MYRTRGSFSVAFGVILVAAALSAVACLESGCMGSFHREFGISVDSSGERSGS